MALRPDGKLYFLERTGEVQLWDPATGRVTQAAKLDVAVQGEGGLISIALDPAFEENGSVYLYYSRIPIAEDVLVRFTANPDGTLLPSSEVPILQVPSNRENHQGADIVFAPDGTMMLSIGDHTIPFGDSLGYAPLDERPGQEGFNSQLTAGNPFDLRGAILRINPDGSIPDGNLYRRDGSEGRPEIYVKGTRNPFRFALERGRPHVGTPCQRQGRYRCGKRSDRDPQFARLVDDLADSLPMTDFST